MSESNHTLSINHMQQGTLFVVSAPSGAGKTSLVKALYTRMEGLSVSVSHTTRPQRPGEQEGLDYYFVSHDEFNAMVAKDDFLEHARVFDNQYGTARATVVSQLKSGEDVLLEIDWQGAGQVKRLLPECRSIFILPPSLEALQQRLRGRGQDDEAIIARRMRDAVAEMSHYAEYDYLIVNDVFETALQELQSIVTASRAETSYQSMHLRGLLDSLLSG